MLETQNLVLIIPLKKSKISAELVNVVSLKPIDESIIKLLSKDWRNRIYPVNKNNAQNILRTVRGAGYSIDINAA